MIVDLKYHITSLVAVFLALAIGILVGSVMLGNETIVWQQEQLADNLAEEIRLLRLDNRQLKERIVNMEKSAASQSDFSSKIIPEMLNQRLACLQVAVVDTSNSGLSEEVIRILKLAGARIASVTVVVDDLGITKANKQQKIKEYLDLEQVNAELATRRIAQQVARGIVPGDNLAVLNLLEQAGLIKKTGEASVPINAVVVVGGRREFVSGQSTVNVIDIPLMEYLLKAGLKVYGVEAVDTAVSYMPYYQSLKISTVDNIDTLPGSVALVLAMEGKQGNYGIKTSARSLLPQASAEDKH